MMILQLFLEILIDILDGVSYIIGEILFLPLVFICLVAGILIVSPTMILISFLAMIVSRYYSYNN